MTHAGSAACTVPSSSTTSALTGPSERSSNQPGLL